MRNDLTDITIVMDRSGSMDTCRTEAENGVNKFIEEQRDGEGECLLTLVQFDDEYEFVHKGVNIRDVPSYKLVPRSMTALLDAIGRAIGETGERLSAMKEEDRPGLVIFVIMTDGHENASKEYSGEKIKEMITHQQEKYNWKFIFLGANQDAFEVSRDYGIQAAGVSNFSVQNAAKAYGSTSANVMRMRSSALVGADVSCEFTEEEKEAME